MNKCIDWELQIKLKSGNVGHRLWGFEAKF